MTVTQWGSGPTGKSAAPRRRRSRVSKARVLRVLLVLLGILVVLGGIGAWLANSWIGTYRLIGQVEADVGATRAAIESQDLGAAAGSIDALAVSSRALATESGGFAWRILGSLPVVGERATAVEDLSSSLADVSEAAQPLVPFAQAVADGSLRRSDGSYDLAPVVAASPDLRRLAAVMDASAQRVGRLNPESLGEPLASAAVEFSSLLAGGASTVQTAARAAEWLPALLGADGPRTWLVLLQNPAESRGSGGFIGGYALIQADDGRLALLKSDTNSVINQGSIPTAGAPEDARVLWGDLLEKWNTYNLSPHFPLTARLSADGMAAIGQPVSGVVAIDPQTVAALLQLTGPVTYQGVTLTADNAVEWLTVGAYQQFPDDARRDEVTMGLVTAVFQAFLASSPGPVDLIESLRQPALDRHLLAWSADPDEQAWLETTSLAGTVPDSPGPIVAVALNNAAANKIDAFVQSEVDYAPGQCLTQPTTFSSLTLRLRNDAPAGLSGGNYGRLDRPGAADAPPGLSDGSTKLLVHLYMPIGSTYTGGTIDGQPLELFAGTERNRPVWWNYVELPRGAERELVVGFTEPVVTGVAPRVIPQPMAASQVVTITPGAGCS